MKSVNVAELRGHLGEFLACVQKGEEVQVCKRNKAVARILKMPGQSGRNATKLGCARGTVQILGDIIAPAMNDDEWEMLT